MFVFENMENLKAFIREQTLFTNEAAKFLGISSQRLHQLVQAGKLQPIKTNASGTLFLKSDLEKRKEELTDYASPAILENRIQKKLSIMNSFEVIQRAINYYTVQHLCNYSDRKASALFEQMQQHLDVTAPSGVFLKEAAKFLSVTPTDLDKVCKKVMLGFDSLNENDHVVALDQDLYPRRLALTEYAPPFLFMRGNPRLAQMRAVAVVGTRQPTAEGTEKAKILAKLLGRHQIVVASGLAAGIDRAAHEGALESKTPTIAVIGTPLTKAYPKENAALQQRIAEEGLVISQFPPSAPVQRWNFPARNAVMSGICLATVVVEAGETSGALIQADFALKQGRLVFIPQSAVDNPNLKWPRKYLERTGAASFKKIDELIEKLQQSHVIDVPRQGNKDRISSCLEVAVHFVSRG